MGHTPPNEDTDRLSDLPQDVLVHILSFLPTKSAAQTSLLSRRFHHLWESSLFLNIDTYAYTRNRMTPSGLVKFANQTFSRCTPLSPLLHLRIRLLFRTDDKPLSTSHIDTVLAKASAFGIRHLSVQLCSYMGMWQTILPRILSCFSSLESLLLENVFLHQLPYSTPINLNQLRSLSIRIPAEIHTEFINRVVPQLHALEDLQIMSSHYGTHFLNLKSVTLRILKLDLDTHDLRIFAPSLELFELKSGIYNPLTQGQGDLEMPALRKAVIQLKLITEKNVEAISKMLHDISNVQELHIDIMESKEQIDTFHALLLPGVDPPTFFNLKHFHLEICFHEYNIEDLVTLLQHSPSIESIKLMHKPPFRARKDKKKKLWRSQLPRNAEGNYRHAYFEDLHIPKNKELLRGQLIGRQSSKRSKT